MGGRGKRGKGGTRGEGRRERRVGEKRRKRGGAGPGMGTRVRWTRRCALLGRRRGGGRSLLREKSLEEDPFRARSRGKELGSPWLPEAADFKSWAGWGLILQAVCVQSGRGRLGPKKVTKAAWSRTLGAMGPLDSPRPYTSLNPGQHRCSLCRAAGPECSA